jgi:hypothetical protein
MPSAETSRRRALAALLLTVGATLLAACGEAAGPSRDAAGAISQPIETRLLALRVGDCVENMRMGLEQPDGGYNGVPKIIAVPCTRPHDAEILRITTIGDGDWPGFHIVEGEAARGRQELRARLARAKAAAGGQDLDLFTFRPTQERWEFEDQKRVYFVVLYPKPQSAPAPS